MDVEGHVHECVIHKGPVPCNEDNCHIANFVCPACQAKLDAEAEEKSESDDEPAHQVESAVDPPPDEKVADKEEPSESESNSDTESEEESAGEEEQKPQHSVHRISTHRARSAKSKKK